MTGTADSGSYAQELPLYGIHDFLADVPIDAPVFVVEGPPARDALLAQGFHAVATVTGANVCPVDSVLAALVEPVESDGTPRRRRVILWADHDEPGRKHMKAIGAALTRLGIGSVELVWGTEPGDDAVDYFQRGGTSARLQEMIADLPRVDDLGRVLCSVCTSPHAPEAERRTNLAVERERVRRWPLCSRCREFGQQRELAAATRPPRYVASSSETRPQRCTIGRCSAPLSTP